METKLLGLERLETFFKEYKGEVVGHGFNLTRFSPVCAYLTAMGLKHVVTDQDGLITHMDQHGEVHEISAGPGILVFMDLLDTGNFRGITGALALELLIKAGTITLDNL